MEKDEQLKELKRQENEIAKRQKEQDNKIAKDRQNSRIDGLLRLYQFVGSIVTSDVSTLDIRVRKDIIVELSHMVNIIERDDWDTVHLHDAFPNIDIRMLTYGCSINTKCPFLSAVLMEIGMSSKDYRSYKIRAGAMIAMEHKRKMGKRK